MFNSADLEKVIRKDNPTYERVLQSDLHALVALLNRAGFTAQQVAAEMKKISADKWRKYTQTRAYLIREIPGLEPLLRAALINFRTSSLTPLPGGNIKHDAAWESDSGNLQDLAKMFVREKVSWDTPSPNARPLLDAAYQSAGQHFGVGNAVTSPGSAGNMSDTHDAKGAWSPNVFKTPIQGTVSYTCKQVYQYSDDNKMSWKDIPNSTYEITRSVSAAGNKIQMKIVKKSVPPSTKQETASNSLTV